VSLPDQIVERLGAIFARENLITHPKTLACPECGERRKWSRRGFQPRG
jgi:hypothetical protein